MIENQNHNPNRLITLPPPQPPNDLIASALFLPLHGINPSHRGRKLRFVGQVLAFHPPTSLLLLTSFSTPSNPRSASPTILVDISVPLLGQSPSSNDISASVESTFSRVPQPPTPVIAGGKIGNVINRESLSLNRGEWVNVVGWLEGDGEKMVRKVKTSSSYLKPLPIILEAIHISNSRAPPIDAIHRGAVSSWNGVIGTPESEIIINGDQEEKEGDQDEDDFEIIEVTPRAKKKNRSKG